MAGYNCRPDNNRHLGRGVGTQAGQIADNQISASNEIPLGSNSRNQSRSRRDSIGEGHARRVIGTCIGNQERIGQVGAHKVQLPLRRRPTGARSRDDQPADW